MDSKQQKVLPVVALLAVLAIGLFVVHELFVSEDEGIPLVSNEDIITPDDNRWLSDNILLGPDGKELQAIHVVEEDVHNIPPPPNLTNEDIEKLNMDRVEKHLGTPYVPITGEGTLVVPLVLNEEEVLFSGNEYSLGGWINDSVFTSTEFVDDCYPGCSGMQYLYDLKTDTKTIFENNVDEWRESPNGKFALLYEKKGIKGSWGKDNVLYIKDLKTDEIKNFVTVDFCPWAFEWSPDSAFISMLDWCDYNYDVGPSVYLLAADAGSLSERILLGYTKYKEIERPLNEQLIYWSPDSTKLHAGDSNVVFDVNTRKELFRSDSSFVSSFAWSPDSTKLMMKVHGLGFIIVDSSGSIERYLLPDIQSLDIAWMLDSRHLLVAIQKRNADKFLYYFDTKTSNVGQVMELGGKSLYGRLLVSPDSEYVVYIDNDSIKTRKVQSLLNL